MVVAEKTNGAQGAPEQKPVMGGALPPRSDVRVENANISFMRMFVTGGGRRREAERREGYLPEAVPCRTGMSLMANTRVLLGSRLWSAEDRSVPDLGPNVAERQNGAAQKLQSELR